MSVFDGIDPDEAYWDRRDWAQLMSELGSERYVEDLEEDER